MPTLTLGQLKSRERKIKFTKRDRADLIDYLSSLPMSERKELCEWVKDNLKEFCPEEREVYFAAAQRRGLEKLKSLDEKKHRAKVAGIKLSSVKKGVFDGECDGTERSPQHVEHRQAGAERVSKTNETKNAPKKKGDTAKAKKKTVRKP